MGESVGNDGRTHRSGIGYGKIAAAITAFGVFATLSGAADAVALSCAPAAAASPSHAATLCSEAVSFAKQNITKGKAASQNQGTIQLTVLRATERGAALAGVWRDQNGKVLAKTELSAAFFDKASSPKLRKTFIRTFFQQLAPPLLKPKP